MTSKLTKDELNNLLNYYKEVRDDINLFVENVTNILQSDRIIKGLNPLTRTRVKDIESLKGKILDKYDEEMTPITRDSLLQFIEDLGGIRLIVANKYDVKKAHDQILELSKQKYWFLKKQDIYVWVKDRWKEESQLSEHDLVVRPVYRSRHYILQSTNGNLEIRCELQLRTILEEAVFENYHRLIYKHVSNTQTEVVMASVAEICAIADELIFHCYDWSLSK